LELKTFTSKVKRCKRFDQSGEGKERLPGSEFSLLLCGAAFGQIKSGVITGIVTDSAGAVVPGANAAFGATLQHSTLDSAANALLKLSLGQLLDTAANFWRLYSGCL
jgi:hypothetical protein